MVHHWWPQFFDCTNLANFMAKQDWRKYCRGQKTHQPNLIPLVFLALIFYHASSSQNGLRSNKWGKYWNIEPRKLKCIRKTRSGKKNLMLSHVLDGWYKSGQYFWEQVYFRIYGTMNSFSLKLTWIYWHLKIVLHLKMYILKCWVIIKQGVGMSFV